MKMKLKNKKALITGISGDIGSAIARAFLNEGIYVGGTYFTNKPKETINNSRFYKCDIRKYKQVKSTVKKFLKDYKSGSQKTSKT